MPRGMISTDLDALPTYAFLPKIDVGKPQGKDPNDIIPALAAAGKWMPATPCTVRRPRAVRQNNFNSKSEASRSDSCTSGSSADSACRSPCDVGYARHVPRVARRIVRDGAPLALPICFSGSGPARTPRPESASGLQGHGQNREHSPDPVSDRPPNPMPARAPVTLHQEAWGVDATKGWIGLHGTRTMRASDDSRCFHNDNDSSFMLPPDFRRLQRRPSGDSAAGDTSRAPSVQSSDVSKESVADAEELDTEGTSTKPSLRIPRRRGCIILGGGGTVSARMPYTAR